MGEKYRRNEKKKKKNTGSKLPHLQFMYKYVFIMSYYGFKGALDNFSLIPPIFFQKKLRFLHH